jgi:chaperonin GroEL
MCISDDVDDFKALLPAINHAKQHGKFLVIIGKKFSEDVIRNCEKNFMYGTRVIPVVAPDFGDRMIFNLEDIAIYADTTVISMTEIKAATKGEFEMPKMGAIDTLKVGSNYTKLYSEEADSRVATRIKQLTNQINAANNKFDKKKLEKRIAQLSAGLAVIRVGGKTSTEIQERFDRYEDAVGATLAASREGVLPGGGIALYNASMGIERTSEPDTQFGLGWDNMLMACLAPHHQILANAEIEGDGSQDDPSMGIDAQTGEIVNMFDAGIVDPFVVTTSALDSALSIANLLLGVGCTIDSTSINIIPG